MYESECVGYPVIAFEESENSEIFIFKIYFKSEKKLV